MTAFTPVSNIATYTDLQNAVCDLLDRTDIATQVPLFIQLVESGVNRMLRHPSMVARANTVGQRQDIKIPLPDDWLETRNVEITFLVEDTENPGVFLDADTVQATYQSPDAIDQMKEENPQWRPERNEYFFSYYDNVIELYPFTEQNFRLTLDYYQAIPPLATASNGKNWLLTKAPDLYYYGAAMHSAPWLRDDPRLTVWNEMYMSALGQLQTAGERSMTSGSRLTRPVPVCFG